MPLMSVLSDQDLVHRLEKGVLKLEPFAQSNLGQYFGSALFSGFRVNARVIER